MILAAGFGTRLLPHTKLRPKPLFPLLNRPLLLLTIDHLKTLGFTRIVVNCHYLAEQIEQAVAGTGVILQKEESILGTGGGLRRAMQHFTREPVLVTNGDIYHTIDLLRLYQQHRQGRSRITLAMHHAPRFNSVFCTDEQILGFAEKKEGSLAYTGVQVLDPEVLDGISPETYSCIISQYRQLLRDGEYLRGVRVDRSQDFFWTDIGTPEDYLRLHGDLLLGRVSCWSVLKKPETRFPGAENIALNGAALSQWAVIGKGVQLGPDCSLCRSVVWDGLELAPGTRVVDTLVSGAGDD